MKSIQSIYDLIDSDSFREKSPMYLGDKSISKLRVYMNGYYFCEMLNGNKSDTYPSFWLFFHWVKKKYNHNGSFHYWDGIILGICGDDEAKALDTFFELFDEFRNGQIVNSVKTSIGEEATSFFHSPEKKRKRFRVKDRNHLLIGPAEEIIILEYDNSIGCSVHHCIGEGLIVKEYYPTSTEAIISVIEEYGNSLEWEINPDGVPDEVYRIINE